MARFTRQTRRNDSKIAGMYDLEERLGAGHFAEVKLARHVFTGERVAVKVIDKLKLDDMAKHHLYQEVRCMKLVQHPNIVRLYEVIDTKTKLYLVQELGDGGDMYDYIMKHERGLSEEKARRYFRQILQAIDYCHKLYVVHRDLKPENVIFFKKFDVAKLTDFGFSNKFMPGKKLETACGSLAYSAPEILLGDSYDAPAVDVWSLGVILYMMVVGKAPFYEANESETLTMILDCKFHIPDHVTSSCKSLISRMIVRDASKRASLEDIISDPWILQDNGPLIVATVPLANQVRLGVDQHNEVVQKMQLGDIADQETIKKCLDSGSYNHVSATYYLLAEQILRRMPWHKSLSSSSLSSEGSEAKSRVPIKRAIGLPADMEQSPLGTAQDTIADCPSVEELPCDEPDNADEPSVIDIDTNLLTSQLRYHSSESIYDKIQNSSDEQHNEEEIVGAVSVSMTKKQRKTFQKKRVTKVKSTPAFLNQISEERESDLDDSPRCSPRVRRPSRRPLDVLKAQQKNRRPSAASSSGGRRSSSVSSSSEEDGDLDKKMRRLSTERCRRSPKRRSDDEGDGDDGEGGTRSSSGVARKKKMSDRPQTRSQKANTEPGNKSDVRGKCASTHLPSAVLKDRLTAVNLKLEIHKIDSGRNESHPVESSDPSGMDCSDFSGGIIVRSGTKECEGSSSIRMATNDDKSDGLLEDGITEDRIVGDGVVECGIVEHGIMKDGIVRDGIARDGIVRDGIVRDGIVKGGIARDADGIVRDGIARDGIVRDGIVRDGIARGGLVRDGIVRDGIVKGGIARDADGIVRDGIARDGIVRDGIVRDGIARDGIVRDGIVKGGIARDADGIVRDGIARDGIVRDGIVRDGIARDGIVRDGIVRDGIVRDGIARDGIAWDANGIAKDGIVRDGIVRDGIVRDGIAWDANGIARDGIVRDGIAWDANGIARDGIVGDGIVRDGIARDGIVRDGIARDADGIARDGIVRDGLAEGLVVENGVTKSEITDDDNAENRIVEDENLTKSGPTEDGTVKNMIVEDGILDVFQENKCSDDCGNNESTSDKENYSTNCETFMDFSKEDACTQSVIPKVTFRGSDIEEIEMYMKAKETGLELDTVAVRTIFNNRKVSQVTSNCCQII